MVDTPHGVNVSDVDCRCPGSQVAIQALTSRKVDLAFRVYHALIEGAAGDAEGSSQPQAMDTDDPVSVFLATLHRLLYPV